MAIAAGGRWVSGHENDLVGQPQQPSPFYFPILTILSDQFPRTQITMFNLVSRSLCELSGFFATLFTMPPCLDGYSIEFHRYNNWAARTLRYAYWPLLVYAGNFNRSFIEVLDRYPIKVAFFQSGSANVSIAEQLTNFRSSAIVVVEDRADAEVLNAAGLEVLLLDDHLSRRIAEAIEKLARRPTEHYKEKGFSDEEVAPLRLVESFPGKFSFSETALTTLPVTHIRLLRPNETLGNALRHRDVPKPSPQPAANRRIEALLDSAVTVMAEKLIDHLVVEASDSPDPDLPSGLRAPLAKYLASRDAASYETLLAEAREQLGTYPGACDFILCCPSINPRYVLESVDTKFPSRLLRLLFRKASNDYLDYVSPETDFRSKDDSLKYAALVTMLTWENEFLANVLSLYALTSRVPVLRTPKLSSGIYGRLRALRREYDHSRARSFLKQLGKFISDLKDQIPPSMLDFIVQHHNFSIKLISDLPLEWLPIEGVPLVYHRTCSRLPITPGNSLFVHYQSSRVMVHLAEQDIAQTLVLNCLPPEDGAYAYPRVLSDTLRETGMPHRYAEAQSVAKFIDVLKSERPPILIHFGHGSYDRATDRGFLHIGSEKAEIWELQQVTVPLLVMLGACETAAIAETHNTPANAWLAQGARAVLGTYFPVEADLTTVVLVRIMANLWASATGEEPPMTAEMVISKTLMLNRHADYLYPYNKWRIRRDLPPVPGEFLLEFKYRWNKLRGISQAEAHRKYPELVEAALRHFGSELADSFRLFLATEEAIPHTMFFTQLGSPDTILVHPSDPRDRKKRAIPEYWQRRNTEEAVSSESH